MKTISKNGQLFFSAKGNFTVLIICLVYMFHYIPVAANNSAQAYPRSFAELIKKIRPSVVNIIVVKTMSADMPKGSSSGMEDSLRDFFEKYFGDQMPEKYSRNELGTGFIIDTDGFIITTNHVVEQTEEIKVRLSNDKEFLAQIIGRDTKTDLALIKIDANIPLTPLKLGDSDKLEVGDWVVAIGNPFGLGNSATVGIVSAKYRQIGKGAYDDFIQTDASINPGSSGGPLLNINNEAVGINSRIVSQTGENVGIGFAIPINMAKQLLPQLRQGRIKRASLGIVMQDITPALQFKLGLETDKGALISDVVSGGPAEKAGITRGDVILKFDDKSVQSAHDLNVAVASTPINMEVKVEIMRGNLCLKSQIRTVELKEYDDIEPLSEVLPQLGIKLQEITPKMVKDYALLRPYGLFIVDLVDGSPAIEAGLIPGDIIIEFNKQIVHSMQIFKKRLEEVQTGDTILFLVDRDGITFFATLNVRR